MRSLSRTTLCLTFILLAIIATATLTPISVPKGLGGTDKTHHFLAFVALTIPISILKPQWLILAIPVFAIFGGAIEIIQPYFGRSCELADWIADLKGIASGAGLGFLLHSGYNSICRVLYQT